MSWIFKIKHLLKSYLNKGLILFFFISVSQTCLAAKVYGPVTTVVPNAGTVIREVFESAAEARAACIAWVNGMGHTA